MQVIDMKKTSILRRKTQAYRHKRYEQEEKENKKFCAITKKCLTLHKIYKPKT